MEHELVLWRGDGAAGEIVINRPEALNALNSDVLKALDRILDRVAGEQAVHTVILRGAGGRAFVAGGDIREMSGMGAMEAENFVTLGLRAMKKMERMRDKIFIAAIQGFALGGGMELALACDIRVATAGSRFGFPECSIGVSPGLGGTQRLPRLVGRGRAIELLASAGQIGAERAERIGLINAVTPEDGLLPYCHTLAEKIARCSPAAIAMCKELVYSGAELELHKALRMETLAFARCFVTEDQKEGMAAFMEKRPPEFR